MVRYRDRCHMGNRLYSGALAVNVHFVPLPAEERDERALRLRTLLLRGCLRSVRQHTADGRRQAAGASSVIRAQR